MQSAAAKSAGKVILLLMALMQFSSCSDRKRDNPLDPENPRTHGKPEGVAAVAIARSVQVSWSPLDLTDPHTVVIYRKSAAEPSFREIGTVSGPEHRFIDQGLQYGSAYAYYITVRVGSYETPPSDIVEATPGPTFTWIADRTSGYIACLSHDLTRTLGKFGVLNYPYLVSASPKEGAAWLYSRFTEEIYKVDHEGALLASAYNLPNLAAMQVDTLQSKVWVAGTTPSQVLRLGRDGRIEISITSVMQPAALAVDAVSRNVFVIDAARKKVLSYSTSGALIAESVTFLAPSSLALDTSAGTVWVTDSLRMVQLRYDLTTTGVIITGLARASLVATDPSRQTVWVVDLELAGKPATLWRLSRSGAVLSKLSRFGHPQCLAVNEFDGSCLLGDISYAYGGLYRILPDGSQYDYIGAWYTPYDIDIEYHSW